MQRLHSLSAYRFLESGPVVLVTTAADSRKNIMTLGFHMIIEHPGTLGVIIGPWDYSFQLLRRSGACVIAIPAVDQAETVVDIGNCSGAEVDKFQRFGLTTQPADSGPAPLIQQCPVNIECKVIDDSLVERYNLFVLETQRIWVDNARSERRTLHHNGDGTFTVAGETINLQRRMVRWQQFQGELK
ncbi:flavin reductase family protein [Affinibrenneria salicis]|uniref:Flavin reductase family protein n=1 Tax=Affinibrenneria salicis TaxID=2590031 RepID=A0A5J5FY71_9GAMM|nr:flavin reductase family protein [Affinibrenneria salicis]